MPTDKRNPNFEKDTAYIVEGGMILFAPTPSAPHSFGKFFSKRLRALSSPHLNGAALVSSLSDDKIETLLSPEWCRAFALENQRFAPHLGLSTLIRTEYAAHRFRKELGLEKCFLTDRILNELFILHYFRLHCMVNQKPPTTEELEYFENKIRTPPFCRSFAAIHRSLSDRLYSKA